MTSKECKKSCHESDGEIISKSHVNARAQGKVLNFLNERPIQFDYSGNREPVELAASSMDNKSNIIEMQFHISAWFDHRTGNGYWDAAGEQIDEKYWLKKSDCDDQCIDQVSNISCYMHHVGLSHLKLSFNSHSMKIDWYGPLHRFHYIRYFAIHQSRIVRIKNSKWI